MKAEKITALLLTAVLTATAFAGCGEQSNGNATPDEVSSTAQTYTTENEDNLSSEPTDAEATEPTTAQATTAPATTAPATRQEDKTEPVTQPTTAKPVNTAIAVKGISLSSSSLSVTSGSSKTVGVSFNPSNATNLSYNWSISDSTVATVNADGSSITVTGKNPGTANLTVTSSNGKTASCSITVNKAQTHNNTNSKPQNTTKPAADTTPYDDRPIPHSELCTDKNIAKITNAINEYFKGKGMKYTPSLNKNNTGWFFYQTVFDKTATRSVNEVISRATGYLDGEVNACLLGEHLYDDGTESYTYYCTYDKLEYNCYYERLSDGEYEIYLCYG